MTTQNPGGAPVSQDPNAGAAAAPGSAAPPAGQVPPVDSGGSYRPEGLPEQFHGANDRETIDRLYKAFDGYRKEQSQREPMPQDASGYEFTFQADEVKAFAADLTATADPLFKAVKDAAFQAGIPPKAANAFVENIFGAMLNMDVLDKPGSIEEEKIKLAPPEARNLPPAERDAAAQKRVGENIAYLNALVGQGFNADEAKALSGELMAFPELNSLFEHLRNSAGGGRPALGGQPTPPMSKADLDARMTDDRGRVGSGKFDPSYAKETDRLLQQWHANNGG